MWDPKYFNSNSNRSPNIVVMQLKQTNKQTPTLFCTLDVHYTMSRGHMTIIMTLKTKLSRK